MTVAQMASEMRKRYGRERITAEQVGRELGVDRKTAQKKVAHLPVLNMDGQRRWKVTDIAEYIYCNTERSST